MNKGSAGRVWVYVAAIGGFVAGIAVATVFSAWFLASATSSRLIADATTDVTVLENLAAGEVEGARNMVRMRLESAIIGMQHERERLTTTQQSQAQAIEVRAQKVLAPQELPQSAPMQEN